MVYLVLNILMMILAFVGGNNMPGVNAQFLLGINLLLIQILNCVFL